MMAVLRIWSVAKLTVKESVRKRVALGMMVCSVLMTLALGLVARSMQASEGSEMELAVAVQGLLRAIAVFSWVLALFIGVTAVPNEIERRTTYTLLAKPLERYQYVYGKFVGCSMLLAANLTVVGAIVAAILYTQNRSLTINLLQNLATFWVSHTALIALAIAFTLMLPMSVAALVALGVYFLSSVYGYGRQVAETEALHPFWRAMGEFVYILGRYITPRVNWLAVDRPFYSVSTPQPLAVAAVLGYCIVILALGTWAFSRREL
jgi:ABC-type transport system involved in multi-copper enzyme maturation permease subunit